MNVAEKAEIALRMVREAPLIAYDTETSGVDWKRNFPVGYVFTVEGQSVYVPVRHGGGGNLPGARTQPDDPEGQWDVHPFEKAVADAFSDRSRRGYRTVGHNLKFDCHFSVSAGILLGRNLSCTQNTEPLIDEYAKSFSLDSCAQRHGVSAKKGEALYQHIADVLGGPATRDSMGNFWRLSGSDPLAVEYAEGDGISTWELYHSQLEDITKPDAKGNTLERVWEMENRLIWTLFRMERRGVKVDVDYLHELREKIATYAKETGDSLPNGVYSDDNPDGLNLRSPKQMLEYIRDHAGRTDWPLTEKGNPSFTEDYLKTFPEGKVIVDLRKWTNLGNSFVNPLIETHTWKGRVHGNVNQNKADDYGTISGRFSMSSPNMQQIPKHNKELAKLFRRAFVPDDGMLFFEADYSQCEPRLFAHYSGDQRLLDGYNADPPEDVHDIVAKMLNVDRGTKAKRMNMGIFTGMFPKTFAGHMGTDLETATLWWNQWYELFPGVRGFQDMAKQVIQSRGYVTTLLGRRGHMENSRLAYKAVSKIIQGGNADILKWKLAEVDQWLEETGDVAQMLLTVHDSFVFQAPDNKMGLTTAREIISTMEDVRNDPFNLKVPFKVDAGYGDNWAEASFSDNSL